MNTAAPRPLPRALRADALSALVPSVPATLDGDPSVMVESVAPLPPAAAGCLAFCSEARPRMAGRRIGESAAAVVVCTPKARAPEGRTVLRTEAPFLWFTLALQALFPEATGGGVHPDAFVSERAHLGAGVQVGPGAVIEAGAHLGPGCRIGPHAVIHGRTTLGAGCVIGAGAQLGGEGMAVAFDADERPHDFPHLGRLLLGCDVRVGASAVIMRGMLQDTVLADHVRVGNRVSIGHNCTIDRAAWITAGAVVAGSAHIGARAMIGANASVNNKVRVGAGAQVGIGSVATRDVPDGALVFGVPATALPGSFRF